MSDEFLVVMFVPVTKDVYRWETPDPEHGEMMVGHVRISDGGYVLIDPPMVPGLSKALSSIGNCLGVIVTANSHKMGGTYACKAQGNKNVLPGAPEGSAG